MAAARDMLPIRTPLARPILTPCGPQLVWENFWWNFTWGGIWFIFFLGYFYWMNVLALGILGWRY